MNTSKSHRVLVIDAEYAILGVLSGIMARKNIDIHTAQTGEQGIRKIRDESYDLILTDMKMPGLSGIDVLNKVKQLKGDDVPVIGMSGTPWLFGDAKFDGILTKPFSRKDLFDMISSLIPSFAG